MFYLEAGINHFGKIKEANLILNFFLKSKFKNITFMLHNNNFYNFQRAKGINFKLDRKFYINLIKKCHKRNKKVGLSVCSVETFKEIKDLKFDFYKLLSIGINNFKLIKQLKIKKKPVFISTGFGASDLNIKRCLKAFGVKKKLTLLHSPMTYDPSKINFNRIINLKKKIKIPVGYSNHNNNFNNINVLSAYKPDAIFVYCKPKKKKSRIYPDDKHALFLDELDKMRNDYISCLSMNELSRNVKKVNIFKDEFKI